MHIGIPWVFWTGVAVSLFGLTALALAMFGDTLCGMRSETRRRRCPRCWYDMAGSPGLTCPECGRRAKSEQRLARPRRRWWRAAVAVFVLAVGLGGVYNAPIASADWVRHAPSAVLVRVLDDPTVNAIGNTNTRTGTQLRIYNEVIDRYAAGALSLAQRRLLARKQFLPGLPPVSLRSRAVWPVGVEPRVRLIPRFGGVLPRRFESTATFAGAERIVAYHRGFLEETSPRRVWWSRRPAWAGGLQSLGTPSGALDSISIEGRVMEGGEEIWRGVWDINVRVSDRTDDGVFIASASSELTAVVREAVANTLRLHRDRTAVFIDIPADERLLGTAVSLALEFIHDGNAAATAELAWDMDESTLRDIRFRARYSEPGERSGAVTSRHATLEGDVQALRDATRAPEGWVVRIRGTPAQLRRGFGFEHYWAGEFEVPLDVLFRNDR